MENKRIEHLESEIKYLLKRLYEIENEADFQYRNYFYKILEFSKIREMAQDAISGVEL